MKQFVVLVVVILLSSASRSQNLTLFFEDIALPNGTEITRSGLPDTSQLITFLKIKNNSQNLMQVLEKKEELSMLDSAECSLCWAGYCYAPETQVTVFPLTILPGQEITSCFAHYSPHGSKGTSTVRWTFFNSDDPQDSISINVTYHTYPAGISDVSEMGTFLSMPFPNPADNVVKVKYGNFGTARAKLVVLDSQSATVWTTQIDRGLGTLTLYTNDFSEGAYLMVLKDAVKGLSVRKFVVKH